MEKYNEELIQSVIKDFKGRDLKPEDITIYFDMDNVLCLFSVFGDEDIALKKEKHMLMALAQKVFHEVTEDDRKRFLDVLKTEI